MLTSAKQKVPREVIKVEANWKPLASQIKCLLCGYKIPGYNLPANKLLENWRQMERHIAEAHGQEARMEEGEMATWEVTIKIPVTGKDRADAWARASDLAVCLGGNAVSIPTAPIYELGLGDSEQQENDEHRVQMELEYRAQSLQ